MNHLDDENSASKNVFVQEALEAAIKISVALGARPDSDLMVNIVGDNDFYSQERSVCCYCQFGTRDGPRPEAELSGTTCDRLLHRIHQLPWSRRRSLI
jgi:hypothetical protein